LAESWRVVAGSWFQADVAQLVEHSLGKGEVISSILIIGSRVWRFEERFGKAVFSRAAESLKKERL
jgi:hypothetical protein